MKENNMIEARRKKEKMEYLLPELNDEDMSWATDSIQQSWVYNKLGAGDGYVWVDDENGFSMQVVTKGFRLLSIVDHEWCKRTVALLGTTLNSIDHGLDMKSAIVMRYQGGDLEGENNSEKNITESDNIGLEVA